ncbi:MAG: VanZ family protein [Firmicutes bacterium]|nr:VanZ family protein [Bacillota bacterium]
MGEPVSRKWGRRLFLCYCLALVYLLFIRDRAPLDGVPYWEQVQDNCSLRPFRTISSFWDILSRRDYYLEKFGNQNRYRLQASYAVCNLAGNVVLFLPMGIFLPALFPAQRKLRRCLQTALGILLAVELVQLFSLLGTCDVDDVLLNAAGVAMGWGLWRLGRALRKK